MMVMVRWLAHKNLMPEANIEVVYQYEIVPKSRNPISGGALIY